jgi:hypothetical protein
MASILLIKERKIMSQQFGFYLDDTKVGLINKALDLVIKTLQSNAATMTSLYRVEEASDNMTVIDAVKDLKDFIDGKIYQSQYTNIIR